MPISAERKAELRGKFARLDKNGDRKLDFDEFGRLLRRGNPTFSESELRNLFNKCDKNDDGRIDFDEFVEYIFSGEEVHERREMRGPERFYYDKSSYTGTHATGGSANTDRSGSGRDELRPSHASTTPRASHRTSERPSPTRTSERASPKKQAPERDSSSKVLRGPERFFYDKSSYTGVHQHGGPTTIDAATDLGSMIRPNLR